MDIVRQIIRNILVLPITVLYTFWILVLTILSIPINIVNGIIIGFKVANYNYQVKVRDDDTQDFYTKIIDLI